MPRSKQRFSRLKQELQSSLGTAAAGTRSADYLNFLKGVNKIKQTRRPDSSQMARFSVGVLPFGLTPSATPVYHKASMTVQAELIRANFGTDASENKFGIRNDLTGVKEEALFYPALCKIFITLTGELSTPKQSDILKSSPAYKRFKGRSGSVPFGRTVTGVGDATTGTAESTLADVDEEDVKRSLSAALKGKVVGTFKVKGISFVSEIWQSKKGSPGERPTTLPGTIQAPG